MRIVFFDFVTQYAGKPRLTLDLIERLRDAAEVRVVDPYGTCAEYVEAMNQRQIAHEVLQPESRRTRVGGTWFGPRLLGFVRSAPDLLQLQRRLRRALLSAPTDLVWTSSLKGAAVALRAIGRRPMGVAFHYRRNWSPRMARGWRGRVFADPRVTIICETHANQRKLVGRGISEARTAVIPNAIDAAAARRRAEMPLDQPLPYPQRPIRMVLIGTLDRRKGHLCAVRALARLVARGRDALLYIPGDTSDPQSREHVRDIEALAARSGVTDRLHFIGWRRDMIQVIAHSTVACLPSSDEGLPLGLMEAMAVERPVISTSVGGIPDLIDHGRTGWLVDVEDDEALARCIEAAHEPDQRSRVVAAAYEHVSQQFSPRRQIELAVDAFKQAVAAVADR